MSARQVSIEGYPLFNCSEPLLGPTEIKESVRLIYKGLGQVGSEGVRMSTRQVPAECD